MLLDTCVILAFVDPGAEARTTELRRRVGDLLANAPPNVGYVTVYELRRDRVSGSKGIRRRAQIEKLLSTARVLGLDEAAGAGWDTAARLWTRGKEQKLHVNFGDADLFIAATAITHGLTLLTTDARLADSLQRIEHGEHVDLLPVK